MCKECGSYPCVSGCPNAEEEKALLECSKCGCDIREGDEYYHIDNLDMCEECFSEYAELKFKHYAEPDGLFREEDFF